jgi:formylglycine-generating enzyme required for sulfatase activity
MGRYEVTQAPVDGADGVEPVLLPVGERARCLPRRCPSRPVEQVSLEHGRRASSAGIGMRLPTEAEWEYAYRARHDDGVPRLARADPRARATTQIVGNIAWFASNSNSQTRPVGGKAPNGFGLHDMAGNVLEWVNDRYSGTYYASSPSTNPPGPASGAYRVFRGGSWFYGSDTLRSSGRYGDIPASTYYDYGFRVARNP